VVVVIVLVVIVVVVVVVVVVVIPHPLTNSAIADSSCFVPLATFPVGGMNKKGGWNEVMVALMIIVGCVMALVVVVVVVVVVVRNRCSGLWSQWLGEKKVILAFVVGADVKCCDSPVCGFLLFFWGGRTSWYQLF